MYTYEPTPTKRIKQSLSEELLNFISRAFSIKSKNETMEELEAIEYEVAKAPVNVMYSRLLSLLYKMYFIMHKHELEKQYEEVGIRIDTNLGKRLVRMINNCSYAPYITLSYMNPDNIDEPIFHLYVTLNKVTLRPFGTPLSSHDIDMAIYEVEQIVNENYKIAENELKEISEKEKQLFCGNSK